MPQLPLDQVDEHALALLASEICEANAFYRCPYEGGALFVLIVDMYDISGIVVREKFMNLVRWRSLLKRLRIENDMGKVTPVDRSALDEFGRESGIALPSSYCTYCSVFGAGEIAREFYIAVPGFGGRSEIYSLKRLQEMSHDDLEYDEYSPDPKQHERGLFFATDILGSKYFFDPKDVTDARKHEYGVYILRRDWIVRRIADGFWEFDTDLCLGGRHSELIESEDTPGQLFRPVSK